MPRKLRLTLIATGLAAAVAALLYALGLLPPTTAAQRELKAVRHWGYQLQKINIDRMADSAYQMIVVDHSRDGTAKGVLTRADVERLRQRPDGGRRLVIAYLSIGEAEEYRYYWQPEWKEVRPDWLIGENCRWPKNHLVRFWLDGWKDIIYRGKQSYLARILDAGFDGVYLDRIDVYQDYAQEHPAGRAQMIAFVRELAQQARRLRRGALVIAQNAEDLLDSVPYRRTIDAVAKEDLLHGLAGTGKRNTEEMVRWSTERLNLLRRDGKPVFAVEYLTDAGQAQVVRREIKGLGFVPKFAPRALDGADPFEPLPAAVAPSEEKGTPEYAVAHCKPGSVLQ